jgi:hypothetical protein
MRAVPGAAAPDLPVHPPLLPNLLVVLAAVLPPRDAEEVPVAAVRVASEARRQRVGALGVDVGGADDAAEVGLAGRGDPRVEVAADELLVGRLEVVARRHVRKRGLHHR